MKKKTTLLLFLLILSIHASNINVQITAEENNYRPTSLELTPHDPILITSDSDFGIFPGSGTAEDPYRIEGYNIVETNDIGITIIDTTKYFSISNCYIDTGKHGIYTHGIAEGTATIVNNTFINGDCGIVMFFSSGATINNNTCNNNNGIVLLSSSGATINNNTFYNSGLRIHDSSVENYITYTVKNNWVNDKPLGFYTNLEKDTFYEPVYGQLILINCVEMVISNQELSNTLIGLLLYRCENVNITNNVCTNNSNYGIWLRYSDSCLITHNLLQENEEYGVVLGLDSDNNLIHHNNFVDNNLGGLHGNSQAYDDGTNNYWYDTETSEGNYWSDWSGTGTYSIDSSASSEDIYPLNEPAEYSTDENQLNFTFTLLMLIIPLMLTRIISKKVKKE